MGWKGGRMKYRSWIVPVASVLLVTGPVLAATTGQLSGWVVDDQGAPLPGVSVSATSPTQIGGEQLAETDLQGSFLYPRLSPGVYTVVLSLDGFATQELTEVQVRLDRLTEVRVTLPLATFGEQVTVTEETPVVDPVQVSTGQTFTAEYLENAAIGTSARWSFTEVLTQTAGTRSAGMLGGSPTVSVMGSTGGENVFLIDGLDTTNPYFGSPQALVPIDSIQEINFQTGGFEAQYGRATGGVINTVTKSGSNQLSGTLDVRYRDNSLEGSGEHYEPEEQPGRVWIAGATLGGKFIRDRAWYFASLETINWDSTPTGSLTTFEGENLRGFAKVTGQASPNWLVVGKFHRNPIQWLNLYTDPFTTPEANTRWDSDETIAQAEVSGVLSDNFLWEFQFGTQILHDEASPMRGDMSALGHWNMDTGMYTGTDWSIWQRDSERVQLGTTASWLVEDFHGSHDLKVGLDYQRPLIEIDGCWTGNPEGEACRPGLEGFFFQDRTDSEGNSIPYLMQVHPAPPLRESRGSLPSAFVQDLWRLGPNVSLKLGLRWDQASWENDVGQEVAKLEMFQPRLGATWDITRDGRSILRASWGRFMHPSHLRLPRLAQEAAEIYEYWGSCSILGSWDQESCFAIAQMVGFSPTAFRSDPAGWDPIGWFSMMTFGAEPTQVAPDLRATYANELILGFERELFRRTSLELSFIDKSTRDIFDDTCAGNYPSPEIGADCSAMIIANIPEAKRDYRAWILRFESRALDRLHALVSYTYSDSKGSIAWSVLDSVDFDEYPYHFDNRYGYLDNHQRHRFKLNGYALLPWKFDLAFSGIWASPWRWTPVDWTVDGMLRGFEMVEPRGSREGSNETQLDLQLSKAFDVGRVRIKLIGAVINLLDSENPETVCDDIDGCGQFDLGEAWEWQKPRYFELGLRLEY